MVRRCPAASSSGFCRAQIIKRVGGCARRLSAPAQQAYFSSGNCHGGKPMRTTLSALAFAAGLGGIACQSAAALPIAAGAVQEAATPATAVQLVQYAERRGKGTIT